MNGIFEKHCRCSNSVWGLLTAQLGHQDMYNFPKEWWLTGAATIPWTCTKSGENHVKLLKVKVTDFRKQIKLYTIPRFWCGSLSSNFLAIADSANDKKTVSCNFILSSSFHKGLCKSANKDLGQIKPSATWWFLNLAANFCISTNFAFQFCISPICQLQLHLVIPEKFFLMRHMWICHVSNIEVIHSFKKYWVQGNKSKIKQADYIRLFCTAKEVINKWKGNLWNGRKYLQIIYLIRR